MIFGGQTNPGDYHCVAFDETSIKAHLTKSGFTVIDFQEEDIPQDKGFINLNMTVKASKNVSVQKFSLQETPSELSSESVVPSSNKLLNIV